MRPDRNDIAAPELPPKTAWIGERPPPFGRLTAKGPVLVHFFDFAQLNSVRALPYAIAWHARYAAAGLGVLGIHSPRFPFTADRDKLAAALARLESPLTGISKISVQTGTAHGGFVNAYGTVRNDVKIDLRTLEELSRVARTEYGLAGAVRVEIAAPENTAGNVGERSPRLGHPVERELGRAQPRQPICACKHEAVRYVVGGNPRGEIVVASGNNTRARPRDSACRVDAQRRLYVACA